MEPIVPIIEPKAAPLPARGTLADCIASITSGIGLLVALTYSTVFFFRFLENDTHLWGVVSAFLLCFGVGAFGFVPAGMVSRIAWRSYKSGAIKGGLITALILILPWLVLSLTLFTVSDLSKIYSAPLLIAVLVLTAWVLISLRKIKAR